MRISDAHLHLLNAAVPYPGIGDAELLFSCVAQHSEWKTQTAKNDAKVVRFYGIHPWYAEQWDAAVSEELRTVLGDDPEAQVGEIGLDSKRGDLTVQEEVFAEQLDIASEFGRCVNIHNIGCDGKVISMLKEHGKGCGSVILHSFRSPDVRPFLGTDCYFSVNPRILSKSEENIIQILTRIPKDRLLLESDYPYVTKDFISMEEFVARLAGMLGTDPDSLAGTAADNLRRTIG